MEKSVVMMKDYGHITVKLAALLKERSLTRNALAKKIDTRFEVIDRWCKESMEKIDLDILARLCYVLDCNVEDILEYKE